MKAEVDKLDITKLVNVPTTLNNLKTRVGELDVGELKITPVDLKKLSDVVGNEVVEKTVYNKLKAKLNKLDKKITNATILIHINQYNTDKPNLDKKNRNIYKKIPDVTVLVTLVFLIQKLKKLRTKYQTLVA